MQFDKSNMPNEVLQACTTASGARWVIKTESLPWDTVNPDVGYLCLLCGHWFHGKIGMTEPGWHDVVYGHGHIEHCGPILPAKDAWPISKEYDQTISDIDVYLNTALWNQRVKAYDALDWQRYYPEKGYKICSVEIQA